MRRVRSTSQRRKTEGLRGAQLRSGEGGSEPVGTSNDEHLSATLPRHKRNRQRKENTDTEGLVGVRRSTVEGGCFEQRTQVRAQTALERTHESHLAAKIIFAFLRSLYLPEGRTYSLLCYLPKPKESSRRRLSPDQTPNPTQHPSLPTRSACCL